MINLTLNGEKMQAKPDTSLFGLVQIKKLNPDVIVIEHNRDIIPKAKWAEVILKESDYVEIICFVGGG
ncbi:MAG: sulfur carrier protein ThiS [Elusimicrobia bacterium]|nr:sulfur carrier protein ThiS [Elusimicrobiota bacterium]MBU2614958.1 sulfur carrier protein ThiS [Elusimicrobiota bacterium]